MKKIILLLSSIVICQYSFSQKQLDSSTIALERDTTSTNTTTKKDTINQNKSAYEEEIIIDQETTIKEKENPKEDPKIEIAETKEKETKPEKKEESEESEESDSNDISISHKGTFFKNENLQFGGSFGFYVSRGNYDILIMPEVSYLLFKDWRFGIAPIYQYTYYDDGNYEDNVGGIQINTRIDLFRIKNSIGIFLGAAYTYEHHWVTDHNNYSDNIFDIGLGIRKYLEKGSIYAMATWTAYSDYDVRSGNYKNGWFNEIMPTFSIGASF